MGYGLTEQEAQCVVGLSLDSSASQIQSGESKKGCDVGLDARQKNIRPIVAGAFQKGIVKIASFFFQKINRAGDSER